MTDTEKLRRTRIALFELLKMIEDGVLVRNTKDDADPVKYMRQSTDLILAINQAHEIMRIA